MTQTERIEHMERLLDNGKNALSDLSSALSEYSAALTAIEELTEYYESSQWMQDFEDDCDGKIPAGIKRGVLSEDEVYNFLMENGETVEDMKALIEKL